MKTRQIIYIVVGSICILLNLLVDVVQLRDIKNNITSDAYGIGYLFGQHILLLIGIILFISAYKLKKKIRNQKSDQLEKEINDIGKFY